MEAFLNFVTPLWNDTVAPLLIHGGLRVLGAIVIFVIGLILIKWVGKLLREGKLLSKMEATARGFLVSAISVALWAVLILSVVATLGMDMAALLTLLGSCGLAIGLALQGSLANFAGGLLILLFHPFRVGDYVEVGDKAGVVKSISILYTTLTTVDNKDVIMPNGNMANATVVNYSAEDIRRVDLDFNVAYGTDTERIKKILLLLAEKHESVLEDPAPFARLTSQTDSALVFTLRVWVKKENFWDVRFDLLEQVKSAFEKLDVTVPYPQMDVHMVQ